MIRAALPMSISWLTAGLPWQRRWMNYQIPPICTNRIALRN
jgi:hypothetical protein